MQRFIVLHALLRQQIATLSVIAGAAQEAASGVTSAVEAAQQASDSDQTQDSQPEADQTALEDAATDKSPASAAEGPVKQGRTGRALPQASENMYTGAFAFPDSASLQMSQPAVDLPVKPAIKRQSAAAKAAVKGATVAPAAAKQADPASSSGQAVAAQRPSSGSSGGSPTERVLPSGWKRKKASTVVDQPAGAEKLVDTVGAAEEAAADTAGLTCCHGVACYFL